MSHGRTFSRYVHGSAETNDNSCEHAESRDGTEHGTGQRRGDVVRAIGGPDAGADLVGAS